MRTEYVQINYCKDGILSVRIHFVLHRLRTRLYGSVQLITAGVYKRRVICYFLLGISVWPRGLPLTDRDTHGRVQGQRRRSLIKTHVEFQDSVWCGIAWDHVRTQQPGINALRHQYGVSFNTSVDTKLSLRRKSS